MKLILHHIAYAVRSTDEAIKSFASLYPKVNVCRSLEKSQHVYISYLGSDDKDEVIELVEPADESNPVKNLLTDRQSVLYHLCYKVDDFNEGINYFKEAGYFMVTEPFLSTVEKNKWACHFFQPQTGIIEIIGEKKDE